MIRDVDDAMAAVVPVIVQYRRTSNLTHGITTLRDLIELLVRAGHDEAAMELLGALSNPTVKSTYGVESARLDTAREIATARSDDATVSAWIERGSTHSSMWAIDHAIEVLTGIAHPGDAPPVP